MRGLGDPEQVREAVSKVHQGERADRIADIVFVHGLNDNSKNCWTNPKTGFSFPNGLANDFTNLGIWTFDYDAVPLALFGGNALPLQQRATNTLAQLTAEGIGGRPVIFIVHSLGGLVVKWTLRVAQYVTVPSWQKIVEKTRGIVFFSTPHSGADVASWLTVLLSVLPGTVALDNLRAHDPALNDLNTWYRENAPGLGVRTLVYYEEKNTSGLQAAPGIGRFFGGRAGRVIAVRVVDRDSANPGLTGVVPVGVNADHFEVCKVPGTGDFRYKGVKDFISECLSADEKQPEPPANSKLSTLVKPREFNSIQFPNNNAPRYICYISKNRVDSLFAQIDDDTLTNSPRQDFANLTFGDPSTPWLEPRKRNLAVSRLAMVIDHIEKSSEIGDLNKIIKFKQRFTSSWCAVFATFLSEGWDSRSPSVYLTGTIDDFTVRLSCDLSNFSSVHRDGNIYIPTSTSRFVFEGRIPIPLQGVIVIVSVDISAKVINAVPLYLALTAVDVDLGEPSHVAI